MCEQLGSEPDASEIPIELEDMPVEVEWAYHVYSVLPADIDYFNGVFNGKNLALAPQIIKCMELDTPKELLKIIVLIDSLERDQFSKRKKDGR